MTEDVEPRHVERREDESERTGRARPVFGDSTRC